jgi:hypothetical protein
MPCVRESAGATSHLHHLTHPPGVAVRVRHPTDPLEGPVKLFLDTANIDDIAEINRWGVLDGVTTNPTLAGKEGKDFASMIKEICAEVDGDVSAEVVSTDRDGMLDEARKLAEHRVSNVVIKLPLIPEGLAACSQLTQRRGAHERDAVLLAHPGDPRGARRRHLRLPVPRTGRRPRQRRHRAARRDLRDLPRPGLRARRCSPLRCAARSTSPRRHSRVPTSPRCPRRSSTRWSPTR